jgi:hypothetical protein
MEMSLIQKSLPIALALGLFAWGWILLGEGDAQGAGAPIGGGPCEYKDYKGKACIIAVRPLIPPEETGATFEVTYTFQPEGTIEEPFAQTAGRTFLLTMKNGNHLSE